MTARSPQEKAIRQDKLNSLVCDLLNSILKPYLENYSGALISVTRVETSKDGRWAKAWLSIFGADDKSVLKYLTSNLYDIQGELNRHITRKIVPRIQFFVDTSVRFAAHLNEVFKQLEDEPHTPKPNPKSSRRSRATKNIS